VTSWPSPGCPARACATDTSAILRAPSFLPESFRAARRYLGRDAAATA